MTDPQKKGPIANLSDRDKRMLAILGVVLVLGAAFILLTRGGDGDPDVGVIRTPAPRPTPTPTATTTPPPEQPGIFLARDPFEPLIKPIPTGTAAPTASPSPGSDTVSDGHTIALVDIFDSAGTLTAQIEVDGTTYTVSVGETFATSFRLDTLTTECAGITFGDESFELCVGEEVIK